MSNYIASFTKTIPKLLFRTNKGPTVSLRDRRLQNPKRRYYDLYTDEAGMVRPKALWPDTYQARNGASMRRNTRHQNLHVKRSKGGDVVILGVYPGTTIPQDLILVHEFRDHYSLQPREEVSLAELNASITKFLTEEGDRLSKEEWSAKYPKPTETS